MDNAARSEHQGSVIAEFKYDGQRVQIHAIRDARNAMLELPASITIIQLDSHKSSALQFANGIQRTIDVLTNHSRFG